ncbi:MAG: bifunctional diaminohydroxyphosphoribosylaminopyrimidine deaminase/5-amino-6-(5-phosphoribosylamino)uracil reductase RibD [Kiritimatiellales bacterium]|nr:bifunctional diaminohydroxyphosphoribosylaminopyrimidine deaminase/5-amino-6-(5-phosphoribosylamino)uracil reductase RibD [Kiritimatiellota bacterium]MBL7012630.1 bifunctional diaminohydroxyphosphoribosylaminopyrimidine deaminase/5-amino-6-(5-phosphoribosylamino)uracil reductase RibD [Kiritimatiellales bacterium]
MDKHVPFMQRALELARRGEGMTCPNPPVGAVLVQNGKIIAEGFHKKAGSPHAEVNCLRQVDGQTSKRLSSAILYVSLEPCSTTGRTPPCTDLILERDIRRVVIGCKDPNPAHAGRGIRKLRRAGVEVITGVCRKEAEALIAPFAKRMLIGLPYVTLKLGVTLDGRIADSSGKSQWITGPAARKKVQELRRAADAIMVGAGTVRADNPSLLPRPAKGRTPWRVVVGSDIPKTSNVLTDDAASRTLVVNGPLKKVLRDLAKNDVMHVVCEGGGELAASLIRAGLVDEFVIFMAPSLLGGTGFPMVGKKGWALANMPRLSFQTLEKCGEDILIRAVPVKEN